MNPVMFKIGNFEIMWYSFLLLIGVIVGLVLLLREGKKQNYPTDFLFYLCLLAVVIYWCWIYITVKEVAQ